VDGVKLGRYRHFKGGEYVVIGTATHTETGEVFVLYRSLEEPARLWIRPRRLFLEPVVDDGERRPRFAYLGESPAWAGGPG
jgi:hypothetical protein